MVQGGGGGWVTIPRSGPLVEVGGRVGVAVGRTAIARAVAVEAAAVCWLTAVRVAAIAVPMFSPAWVVASARWVSARMAPDGRAHGVIDGDLRGGGDDDRGERRFGGREGRLRPTGRHEQRGQQ